jgi:electron transfer flavoprotein beta subunit
VTAFHTIVCIKAVVARAPRGKIIRSAENSRFNPFDRPALETALQLRAHYGGRVTVLSMGPPSSGAVMAEALALGADRAVLACDPALAGADTLATAVTLAAAIRKLAPYHLVLFGTRTSDSDTGQVGPQTAVVLDLPLVTGVHALSPAERHLQVERTMDHLVESFAVDFPAALTVRPEIHPPRDIALSGLAEAFDTPKVEIWTLADLELDAKDTGEPGSPTRVLAIRPCRHERQGQFLEGDNAELADQLIRQWTQRGLLN